MIFILFSFSQVYSHSLDMAVIQGTDPYICPGGRNYQFLYPLYIVFYFNWLSIIDICESLSFFHALDAI